MDVQKFVEVAMMVLAVAGGVALGLPALLQALVLFFKLVPGEQPDAFLEKKLLPFCEKVAEFVKKFYPQAPKQQ